MRARPPSLPPSPNWPPALEHQAGPARRRRRRPPPSSNRSAPAMFNPTTFALID
ncbi:hypothetical protein OsI_38788 [Oryza sativa Indica Group]|uniref:Uncharacterized protein n=2 Tax=Oryza sativa TaxID=4530 RepID=B9GDU7_ORYSJ|nr:hypothetical protein OsI_38788 [Oryza sativa Indica Group]EEE53454.1 hypothetical protein OsJ_36564 [Oryza sativa Japonica Group]